MNNSKILLIFIVLMVIAGSFFYYTADKAHKADRAGLQSSINNLNLKVVELEKKNKDLEILKEEKAALELKYQSDVQAFEMQIADSKKNESSLKAKLEAATREKDSLTKYIDTNNAIVAKLNKKIEMLQREKKAADELAKSAPLETASAAVSNEETWVDPMNQSGLASSSDKNTQNSAQTMGSKLVNEQIVDLGRIIVHPATNEAAKVENVNSLYGFVVMSAGAEDGLKKDTVVNISRNNRLIAKAVVKKVRENVASAVTLPEWVREEIKVGDLISVNMPLVGGK